MWLEIGIGALVGYAVALSPWPAAAWQVIASLPQADHLGIVIAVFASLVAAFALCIILPLRWCANREFDSSGPCDDRIKTSFRLNLRRRGSIDATASMWWQISAGAVARSGQVGGE